MRPAFLKKVIAVSLCLAMMINIDFNSSATEMIGNATSDTIQEVVTNQDVSVADESQITDSQEDGTVPTEDSGLTEGETTPAEDSSLTEGETAPAEDSTLTEGEDALSDEETTPIDGEAVSTDETTEIVDEETAEAVAPESVLKDAFNAEYMDGSVIVKVSAAAGVLPKGAVLVVTPVVNQEQENLSDEEAAIQDKYDQVLSAIDKAGTNYTGFLAYDISFLVDGVEIEPEGDVSVSMEFVQPVATTDASVDSQVDVLHVDESGAEAVLEEIPGTPSVSVDGEGNLSNVEFVSNEFSTYLIGWTSRNYGGQTPLTTSDYVSVYTDKNVHQYQNLQDNKTSLKINVYVDGVLTKTYPSSGYFQYDNNITSDSFTILENTSGTIKYKLLSVGFIIGTAAETNLASVTSTPFVYSIPIMVKSGVVYNKLNLYLTSIIPTVPTVSTRGNITLNLFDYDTPGTTNTDLSSLTNVGINIGHDLKFSSPGTTNISGWQKMNYYTGSSQVRQQIVKPAISNGFPVLSDGTEHNNQSLDYLFNGTAVTGKTSYMDVDNLFTQVDGYYTYDSTQNYAFYDTSAANTSKNFLVYDNAVGTPGFFPFFKTPSNDYKNASNQYHYFGMTMSATFTQPIDGKVKNTDGTSSPMVFEFAGDDDVWVYIDGVLALDLGGIHGTAGGTIDFNAGTVTVNAPGSTAAPNQTITTTFSNIFGTSGSAVNSTTHRFYDGSLHTISFYYLERGNSDSNCKIKFNLPVIDKNSINITKNVTGINPSISNDTEYQFKLWIKNQADASYTVMPAGTLYDVYNGTTLVATGNVVGANNIFKLKQGQTARFSNIEVTKQYKVEEVNVDYTKYNKVNVVNGNGNTGVYIGFDANNTSASTGDLTVGSNPLVVFNNFARTQSLIVEKKLSSGASTDTYKVKLTTGSGDTLYQGSYYKNDSATAIAAYNADGTISLQQNEKITVKDIPVGTAFKVQETNIAELNNSYVKYLNPVITSVTTSGTYGVDNFVAPVDQVYATGVIKTGVNADIWITNSLALGSLKIIKEIDTANLANGDPIFTFKIEQLNDSNAVINTLYRTVRFSEIGTGINKKFVLLENIPAGKYKVSELKTMRFTETSDLTQPVTVNGEITPAEVTITNKRDDTQNYSHTDVVVNEFKISDDGTISITQNKTVLGVNIVN